MLLEEARRRISPNNSDLGITEILRSLQALIQVIPLPPYSIRWRMVAVGEHEVFIRAIDFAGNVAESDRVLFIVERP